MGGWTSRAARSRRAEAKSARTVRAVAHKGSGQCAGTVVSEKADQGTARLLSKALLFPRCGHPSFAMTCSRNGWSASAWFRLDLGFEVGDYVEEALVEAAVGGDGFLDGDVGDVGAVEDGDAAPLFVVDHVDGVQAVALAEDAVEGGGNAAALGVAQVDGAGFKAGLLLDELGEGFADAGEAGVAEGVDLRRSR